MKLLLPQIVALAAGAGFTGVDLITAVSIALAESGGNPNAYNPERAAGAAEGHGSYGLWQIYLTAHPEYASNPGALFDPPTNAAAAYSVYAAAGNSFRPWSTFKNNAYAANVNAVSAVVQAASQDQVASADAGGAPTDDGTDTNSGFNPGGGSTLGMAVAGVLALWLAWRLIG